MAIIKKSATTNAKETTPYVFKSSTTGNSVYGLIMNVSNNLTVKGSDDAIYNITLEQIIDAVKSGKLELALLPTAGSTQHQQASLDII